MARIKITDLPKNMKISREELKRARGGAYMFHLSPATLSSFKSVLPGADSPLRGMYPKVE